MMRGVSIPRITDVSGRKGSEAGKGRGNEINKNSGHCMGADAESSGSPGGGS